MVERPPGTDPDGILLTFPVAREYAGMRLDRFIQSRIPRLSRTKATVIVRNCAYSADGRRRRASEKVKAGEIVMLVRIRASIRQRAEPVEALIALDGLLLIVHRHPRFMTGRPSETE